MAYDNKKNREFFALILTPGFSAFLVEWPDFGYIQAFYIYYFLTMYYINNSNASIALAK
jgi:hypothetical protein